MKSSLKFHISTLVLSIIILGCSKNNTLNGGNGTTDPPGTETETLTDFEGNVYPTVQIGEQIWMAENLKTRYTRDGTLLAGVYAYNNDESNVAEYGRLYTWNAALNVSPDGWHLPSVEDWEILETHLGTEPAVNLRIGGTSGFNAKLGGYRDYEGGFSNLDRWGMFWTSTVYTDDHSFTRTILHDQTPISPTGYGIVGAISVRLIRD